MRFIFGFVVTVFACGAGPAATFRAGFATIDITPPVWWRMSGYFYERFSTGTHDPLQAKAMVLQQGDERAALVFCDLIGVPSTMTGPVRAAASKKTGIPAANIMIAATHSHTGPLYYGALREYLHGRAVKDNGKDPCEGVDYRRVLSDRLVSLIVQANQQLVPVELEVAHTNLAGLAFNRRYHMKDGSVQFNPGKTNGNVLRPAGPVDPELFVLGIRRRKDYRPIGCLTDFALHADTMGGTEFGADFPWYVERSLKRVAGDEFVSLFGNGPCGDINHIDTADPRPQKGGVETERIGELLGGRVIACFPALRPVREQRFRVRSAVVSLPLQQYSANEIAAARDAMPKIGGKELPFLKQVEANKIMDLQLRGTKDLKEEVQVFRLGADTAIVALPGEIFCELGMAIRKQSPFRNTLIVELANDSIGYVPTKRAFAEGSYEVVNSRVQPGGGEKLVETAVHLLRD